MLTLLLRPTHGQDVTIDSLDNGPGLLPFKLGATKMVTHYHSFLNYIDLDHIHSQIESVQSQILELRPQLNNKTLSLYDPHIEHLSNKLAKISSQINTFETSRNKRGLINGLGSVIKSISGNLDYTDAIKYENAIQILQANEQKLETQINNHVSLNKDWISHSSKLIDSIVTNQDKISKALTSIMKRDASKEADLIMYAHLAQHFLILGDNIEDLSEELSNLENTLSFIRASSTPYSIVSLEEIKNILYKLRILYSKDEILEIDFRNFYEIIKLGYFYLAKQIVIVIKVPIVSPVTYELYKLAIVPNKNHEVLIPSSPFVAISSTDSRYMETECPKVNLWFLCESKPNYKIQNQPDCIQHLIAHQELQEPCKLTQVVLTNEALEALDDKHYTLNFPTPTKIKTSCGQDQYRTLQGSYLAVIPLNCNLNTPGFTISNTNDRIKGHVVRIMEIPQYDESRRTDHPPTVLNTPNLENLHALSTSIMLESPVHLQKADPAIYHTTIPVYLLLLGAGALSTAIMYRRLRTRCRQKTNTTSETNNDVPEVVYATPAPRRIDPSHIRVDQRNISATLSNKILD